MDKPAHDDLPPLEPAPVRVGGGTIIRVKRKRNEQPLESLVIVGMPPAKRVAFDALTSAFASLSTTGAPTQPEQAVAPTRRLYRLAHTTKSTKEDETKTALDRIKDLKQKRKRTIEVSKEEKSRQTVQQKQEQARSARLKVVERHRTKAGTILDVSVERDDEGTRDATKMPPPVYTKPSGAPKATTTSTSTTRKLPSARRQGGPRFVPNLAAAKTREQVRESEQRKREQASPYASIDDETAFNRYLPMVKQYLDEVKGKAKLSDDDDEYEYDLYYFDDTADREELERDYGLVHIESFDEDLVVENEYDNSDEDYDSEDSNDENNPNYEYPEEEEDDDSGSDSEGAGLSSDDDDDGRLVWQQQQRHEYAKVAYDAGLDDDDVDDDGGEDDGTMDTGIVAPPMVQPDFAFFQTWRAMRK